MNLGDFNSYFEIFAVLNLVYAGSKKFRDIYKKKISKINDSIRISVDEDSEKVRENIESHKTTYKNYLSQNNSSMSPDEVEIVFKRCCERIDEIKKAFNKKDLSLIEKGEMNEDFSKVFRSNFLLTGLFSLSYIVLSGFSVSGNLIISTPSYNTLILLSLITFFYNILLLLFSFTKNNERAISISIPFSIIIFTFFITFKFLAEKIIIDLPLETMMIFYLSLVTLPFVMYVVRVVLFKKYYDIKVIYNRTYTRAYLHKAVEGVFEDFMGVKITKGRKSLLKRIYYTIIYESNFMRKNRI